MLIGDFNSEPSDPTLDRFIQENLLHCHIKAKTCFKSSNGSCIDLILSNQKYGLQKTGTLDTGLSDFHHLIYTQLKSKYSRLPPKTVTYRSYGNFILDDFLQDLSLNVTSSEIKHYRLFEEIFVNTLDKHAPRKSRLVRGNEKPHMNRALRKAIMERSKLRNIFRRSKLHSDLLAYRRQRNRVCKLNKNSRKAYFESVASNPNFNSSQNFWSICKPFFSDKHTVSEKVFLVHNDEIISNDSVTAKIFNSYFNDITKNLNLKSWDPGSYISYPNDPVRNAISKFEHHPSILKIKEVFGESSTFDFVETNTESVHKLVLSLNCRKATSCDINPKILKMSADVCSFAIKNCFNTSLSSSSFPSELKRASITPVYKKDDATCVENYRPISILPTVSKVFEKLMAEQLIPFLQARFSKLLCGFRKAHSTQHALLRLLNRWQKALDDSNIVGTVLMDLSKAYDCLPHDLLIAKLAAYGVNYHSLKFIYDYLSNRIHRVKIGNKFSAFLYVLLGIPQGSILGPLLFNIFINDLLLSTSVRESEICNFADDNTLFFSAKTLDRVIGILGADTLDVIKWFNINGLVANPGKFQVMFLGTNISVDNFQFGDIIVDTSNSVKLLGILIDDKLRFKEHLDGKCKKASSKTKALLRIRSYISVKTAKSLCNAYILSHFDYCPLIWMRFDKASNNLMNKIHHRALSVVYQNFNSSLLDLLSFSHGVTLHVSFIRKLLQEIFKFVNGLGPSFMSELFVPKFSGYTLRRGQQLVLPPTKTVKFGMHSLSFVGSLIWDRLPRDIKDSQSLNVFKSRVKNLPKNFCTCPYCKY